MRILTVLLGFLFALAACAEQAEQSDQQAPAPVFRAGQHFEVLSEPVATRDPNKIEVVEIFSYLCGHCFNFEPLLRNWKAQQPDDVLVIHLPAIWNPNMEPYARAYYTAQSLGIADRVHRPIFQAIHQERKNFRAVRDWANLFAQYGVDPKQVTDTYDSFGVTSQVNQASTRIRAYNTQGTPELVVNGKYRVSSAFNGVDSHADMLRVASYLVDRERAARSN